MYFETRVGGIVNHPDFCLIKEGDKKVQDMVNACIIPKVVLKYIVQLPEIEQWAATNCGKVEPAVREILVDTKCE